MIRKLWDKNRTTRVAKIILASYLLFSICLAPSGTRLLRVNACRDRTKYRDYTPLSVEVDVGSIHFRGEKAEFFVLTTHKGSPVAVTDLNVDLYNPDGVSENLTMRIQEITIGFYKIGYEIPINASEGTYSLLVEARYLTKYVDSRGASFKSFLLSPTLTLWNELYIPMLAKVDENIGTILTEMGYIQVNLTAINAIIVGVTKEVATIKTAIGDVKIDLQAINATILSIIEKTSGYSLELNSTLGRLHLKLDNLTQFMIDSNSTLLGIQGDIYIIRTDLGIIQTDLQAIKDLFDQRPSAFPWSYLLIVAVVCIVALALYRILKPIRPPKSAFPPLRLDS